MKAMTVTCISISEKRAKLNRELMMMKAKKAIMITMKGFDDARALCDSDDDDDDDSCICTGDESDDDDLYTDWWNTGR